MLVGQDKNATGAIVVIDKENVKEYLTKYKLDSDDLVNSKDVYRLIKSELDDLINYHNGFRPYETVSKIIITDKEFTIENGLLTQSLKMKRANIMEEYKDDIENLYQKLG